MGGNLRAGGLCAGKLNIEYMPRDIFEEYKWGFKKFLLSLEESSGYLFYRNSVEIFAGSSNFLFGDEEKSYDQMLEYKKTIGDVDIQIDRNDHDEFALVLKKQLFNSLDGFEIVHAVDKGTQINCLVEVPDKYKPFFFYNDGNQDINTHYVQIDFEMTEFIGEKPDEFSKLGHCSSWVDLELGVKGVFRAFLLRSLASSTVNDIGYPIAIVTPALGVKIERNGVDNVKVRIKDTMSAIPKTFSVDRGLRDKFFILKDSDGDYIKYDIDGVEHVLCREEKGLQANAYCRDLKEISKCLIGKEAGFNVLSSFHALLNEVRLMPPNRQLQIVKSMVIYMWDVKRGQELERENACQDHANKLVAYLELRKFINIDEHIVSDIHDVIIHYYKDYGKPRERISTENWVYE